MAETKPKFHHKSIVFTSERIRDRLSLTSNDAARINPPQSITAYFHKSVRIHVRIPPLSVYGSTRAPTANVLLSFDHPNHVESIVYKPKS